MRFVRESTSTEFEDDAEEVSVLAEPKPGFSDADVVEELRACGGRRVRVLAPGFISAHAVRSSLHRVAGVAHVHVKAEKQPRTA